MTIFDVLRYPVSDKMSISNLDRMPIEVIREWYIQDLQGVYNKPTVIEIHDKWWHWRLSFRDKEYKLKELKEKIAAYEEPVEEIPSN
jgi:hypothetical protein